MAGPGAMTKRITLYPRKSRNFRLTHDELVAVAAKLKIPVRHVVEYHRFMHGHPTTKMAPATRKYIREKITAPNFDRLDNAVGLKPEGLSPGLSASQRKDTN